MVPVNLSVMMHPYIEVAVINQVLKGARPSFSKDGATPKEVRALIEVGQVKCKLTLAAWLDEESNQQVQTLIVERINGAFIMNQFEPSFFSELAAHHTRTPAPPLH